MIDKATLRAVMSELGSNGGHARAKILTAKERMRIARKAWLASARARRAKAELSGQAGMGNAQGEA